MKLSLKFAALCSIAAPLFVHNVVAGTPAEHFVHLEKRATTYTPCQHNVTTKPWDDCVATLLRYSLSISNFVKWNTGISSDCSGFTPGKTYCVFKSDLPKVSTDGSCGFSATTNVTTTCVGSSFGNCCSASGYCGSTSDYCGVNKCQSGACTGSQFYTLDGSCGMNNGGRICGGSYGNCCSNSGYCGSTSDFCGIGKCQSGACSTTSKSSTAASTTTSRAPLATPGSISPDGTCGYVNKYKCNSTSSAACCSAAGWCGTSFFHCDSTMGCQTAFGKCQNSKSPGGKF